MKIKLSDEFYNTEAVVDLGNAMEGNLTEIYETEENILISFSSSQGYNKLIRTKSVCFTH